MLMGCCRVCSRFCCRYLRYWALRRRLHRLRFRFRPALKRDPGSVPRPRPEPLPGNTWAGAKGPIFAGLRWGLAWSLARWGEQWQTGPIRPCCRSQC
jgi:hypothetical protein